MSFRHVVGYQHLNDFQYQTCNLTFINQADFCVLVVLCYCILYGLVFKLDNIFPLVPVMYKLIKVVIIGEYFVLTGYEIKVEHKGEIILSMPTATHIYLLY